MVCHLERCYASKGSFTRAQDDIIPLEMYRHFCRYFTWPTSGQFKAVTMVYQDLFKGRSRRGKMRCMNRVKDFRFERSISIVNVRNMDSEAENWRADPEGLRPLDTMTSKACERLARRAIHFHRFITDFRRTGNQNPPAEAKVVPPHACIHVVERRGNAEEEKGTNE